MGEANFWRDGRVAAAARRAAINSLVRVDRGRSRVAIVDEAGEEEVSYPIVWEVCSTCGGRGSHVNPAIDADGLTAEDFASDPDFAEEYRSGRYDETCGDCGGDRVVWALDREKLSPVAIRQFNEAIAAAVADADEERRAMERGY